MDKGTVFSKTGKGLLEIKNKSNRLPKDQLKILNLVDGKTALGDLVAQSRIPEIELRKLVGLLCDGGFIKELTGPAVDDNFPRAGVPAVPDSAAGEDDLDFTKILTPTEPAKPAVSAAPAAAPPQSSTRTPAPPTPLRTQEEQRSRLEEEYVRRQAAAEQQRKAQEQRTPPAPPHETADEDLADLDAELDALRDKTAPPSPPPAAPQAIARPATEEPAPTIPNLSPQPIAASPPGTPVDSPPQDLSGAFERARRDAEQRAREEAIRIQQESLDRRSRAPRKPK
jgi:hypothetical protein